MANYIGILQVAQHQNNYGRKNSWSSDYNITFKLNLRNPTPGEVIQNVTSYKNMNVRQIKEQMENMNIQKVTSICPYFFQHLYVAFYKNGQSMHFKVVRHLWCKKQTPLYVSLNSAARPLMKMCKGVGFSVNFPA